jgi:hypothetical protein
MLRLAGPDCDIAGEWVAKTYAAMSTSRKNIILKSIRKTELFASVNSFHELWPLYTK